MFTMVTSSKKIHLRGDFMIKEKKEKRITMRLSCSDYEYLGIVAYMAGMTISQYLRTVLNASIAAVKVQEKKGTVNIEDIKAILNN